MALPLFSLVMSRVKRCCFRMSTTALALSALRTYAARVAPAQFLRAFVERPAAVTATLPTRGME